MSLGAVSELYWAAFTKRFRRCSSGQPKCIPHWITDNIEEISIPIPYPVDGGGHKLSENKLYDGVAVVLWWFKELYNWSRFFLGRTNEGVPRGPPWPKNRSTHRCQPVLPTYYRVSVLIAVLVQYISAYLIHICFCRIIIRPSGKNSLWPPAHLFWDKIPCEWVDKRNGSYLEKIT